MPIKMKRGTYIGGRLELRGKTALLLVSDAPEILAQFDDVATGLGHGWHAFQSNEWSIDESA